MAYSWEVGATPTFRALSYDDYAKPLQQATDFHKELETQYGELDAKASMWDKLANDIKGKDSDAYKQYKNYADDLRSQANDLAKNGLQYGSRKALLNMVGRYSSEITPIEEAWNRRKQLADDERKAMIANPNLRFERHAGRESIDFFMDNPDWSANAVDFNNYYNKLKGEMSQYKTQILTGLDNITKNMTGNGKITAENLKWVPSAVRGFYERVITKGYTVDELAKELNDPNSNISKDILATMASSGVNDFNFGYSYDDEETAKQRKVDFMNEFQNYLKGAANYALGDTQFDRIEDKWLFQKDQQASQARENEKNRQLQRELAAARGGGGSKTQDNVSPWNAKQHGVEFIKGDEKEQSRQKDLNNLKDYMKLKEIYGNEVDNLPYDKYFHALKALRDGKTSDEIVKYANDMWAKQEARGIPAGATGAQPFKNYHPDWKKNIRKGYTGISKDIDDILEEAKLGNSNISESDLRTIKSFRDGTLNVDNGASVVENIMKRYGKNGLATESYDDYLKRITSEYETNQNEMNDIINDKALSTLGSITNFANSKNADQQVIGKLGALGNDTELSELNETNGKKTGNTKKVSEVIGMMNADGAQTRYSVYNNSDGIGIAVNITEKSGDVHEYRLPYAALRGWEGISDMTGNNIYANDIEGSIVGQTNAIAYKSNVTTADKKKLIELGYYHEENGKKIPYTRREILQKNESLRGNIMNELTRQWDLAFKPAENNNQQYSDGYYYWQQD